MPWSVQARDGQYCVVKEGETEPVPGGCHASRTDAIKHQRALYANESRVAAVYDELDQLPVEPVRVNPTPPPTAHDMPVGDAVKVFMGSLINTVQSFGAHLEQSNQTQEALVASVKQLSSQPPPPVPVVNVEAPQITVEAQPAPVVNVESSKVDVHVPEQPAPQVHVTVEPPKLPAPRAPRGKRIAIERDLATGRVTGATMVPDE